MTLSELWDQLNGHNWFWAMSNPDGQVYREGHKRQKELQSLAAQVDGGAALYNGFAAHYFSPWPAPREPKPPRPEKACQDGTH